MCKDKDLLLEFLVAGTQTVYDEGLRMASNESKTKGETENILYFLAKNLQ